MRELSLNVMDVVQNSITAGATLIRIRIEEHLQKEALLISIEDNGIGMTDEQMKSVKDPFYTTRTTRNVGLGVPLFKMEAEMTGGSFEIFSKYGEGTSVTALFQTDSIDMIPLGDIDGIVHLLVTCNPEIDFCYEMKTMPEDLAYIQLDTREIRQLLGDEILLNMPQVVQWLKEYLFEQRQQYEGSRAERDRGIDPMPD